MLPLDRARAEEEGGDEERVEDELVHQHLLRQGACLCQVAAASLDGTRSGGTCSTVLRIEPPPAHGMRRSSMR